MGDEVDAVIEKYGLRVRNVCGRSVDRISESDVMEVLNALSATYGSSISELIRRADQNKR